MSGDGSRPPPQPGSRAGTAGFSAGGWTTSGSSRSVPTPDTIAMDPAIRTIPIAIERTASVRGRPLSRPVARKRRDKAQLSIGRLHRRVSCSPESGRTHNIQTASRGIAIRYGDPCGARTTSLPHRLCAINSGSGPEHSARTAPKWVGGRPRFPLRSQRSMSGAIGRIKNFPRERSEGVRYRNRVAIRRPSSSRRPIGRRRARSTVTPSARRGGCATAPRSASAADR